MKGGDLKFSKDIVAAALGGFLAKDAFIIFILLHGEPDILDELVLLIGRIWQ